MEKDAFQTGSENLPAQTVAATGSLIAAKGDRWKNIALTGLLISAIVATNFVPVVPPELKPYLGALAASLTGIAGIFHVVLPRP